MNQTMAKSLPLGIYWPDMAVFTTFSCSVESHRRAWKKVNTYFQRITFDEWAAYNCAGALYAYKANREAYKEVILIRSWSVDTSTSLFSSSRE